MKDRHKFFYEITTRICGDLDLERASLETLRYLYGVMPTERLIVSRCDREKRQYRIIVNATLEKAELVNQTVLFSPEAWDRIRRYDRKRASLIDPQEDPVVSAMVPTEHLPENGCVLLPLNLKDSFIGVAIFISGTSRSFLNDDLSLLSTVSKPFGIALSNSLAYLELKHANQKMEEENRTMRRIIGSKEETIFFPDTGTLYPHLDETMEAAIKTALEKTGGRISGPKGAATLLGINPSTLRSRMKKMGII